MRAVGLITEYNPFHNGHLHHLRESRRVTGAKAAVAVMSGHFLQRGEPAQVDKWVRTAMALRGGVDLVVELPFPFACNSAPHFALGAVQLLDSLGGVGTLCFGSESGDLAPLQACAGLLLKRDSEIVAHTAALLRQGRNYPESRAAVVAGFPGPDADPALLTTPNNILGIEYLKALRQTGSRIVPHTVRRIGAGHHDPEAVGTIASATGIRRMLAEGVEVDRYLPPSVLPPFLEAMRQGRTLDLPALHRLLLAPLLQRPPSSLTAIYQIEHGLESRLHAAALESASWGDLTAAVKVRQFTRTRIQRILIYLLNEAHREEMEAFLAAGPLYLRVLGCAPRGRSLLAAGRGERTLPLVQNLSRGSATINRFYGPGTARARLAWRMLEADLRATRLYTLLMKNWTGGNRNRDYFEEVIG